MRVPVRHSVQQTLAYTKKEGEVEEVYCMQVASGGELQQEAMLR
jgi:hypothetical protein